jgi:hypothetical protein
MCGVGAFRRLPSRNDDEPSLGSLDGRVSQERWGQPDRAVLQPNIDLEHDEAEFEDAAD